MTDETSLGQSEATDYLVKAVVHQLGLLSFDVGQWAELDRTSVERAHEDTVHCLQGGSVLGWEPDAGINSSASAQQLVEHTDHYAVFLVFLGRATLARGQDRLAWRIFALNKMLHGINISPLVKMPSRFRLAHCVGTVIGQATLNDRLYVGHGCTIGASGKAEYPTLGAGVSLMANSSILGRCRIGEDVCVGAGVRLVNVDVPARTLVVLGPAGPQMISSSYPRQFSQHVFGSP